MRQGTVSLGTTPFLLGWNAGCVPGVTKVLAKRRVGRPPRGADGFALLSPSRLGLLRERRGAASRPNTADWLVADSKTSATRLLWCLVRKPLRRLFEAGSSGPSQQSPSSGPPNSPRGFGSSTRTVSNGMAGPFSSFRPPVIRPGATTRSSPVPSCAHCLKSE